MNTFKAHIEAQFEPGMSWDNQGEWEIDHIVPLKYNNPTIEETYERLHYTNTQPMWAAENTSKNNRFCGKYSKAWHEIKHGNQKIVYFISGSCPIYVIHR